MPKIPKYLRVWKLNPAWVKAQNPTVESIKIDRYLEGNVVPIRKASRKHRKAYRDTLARLALAAHRSGYNKKNKLYVSSSYRTLKEQQRLYDLFLSGKGALAAIPGTSMHERGLAVDVPNARDKSALIREARKLGLQDDVPSEKWHLSNRRYTP